MVIIKSTQELNEKAIELLQSKTSITNLAPGSRARALVEIFNELLGEAYTTLEFNIYASVISRAEGIFLDWIGELVDCHRNPGEDDGNYRYRITQQVYVAKGSNETAIRLKALSVPGVRDIVTRPFTLGTGSFHVYVIANDPADAENVVANVQAVINENQSWGIRGVATLPKEVRFRINLSLVLDGSGQLNADTIRSSVQRAVRDHINQLSMGEGLIMVDLVSVIKNAHPSIRNFRINSIEVKDRPVIVQDYDIYWDEKLVCDLSDIVVI